MLVYSSHLFEALHEGTWTLSLQTSSFDIDGYYMHIQSDNKLDSMDVRRSRDGLSNALDELGLGKIRMFSEHTCIIHHVTD